MSWLKGFNKKQTAAKGFQKQKSSQALQLQTFILEPILTPSGIIDTDDHSHNPVLDLDTPVLPEDIDLAENELPDVDDTSDVAASLGNNSIADEIDVADIADTHIVDESISDQDFEEISFFQPIDSVDTDAESVDEGITIEQLAIDETDDGDVVATNNIDRVDDLALAGDGDEVFNSLHQDELEIESEIDGEVDTEDRGDAEIAIASLTSQDSTTDTDVESPETIADINSTDVEFPETVADINDTDVEIDADKSDDSDPTSDNSEATDIPESIDISSTFTSGVFTVDETGTVGIDYLFDGGAYKGELAIFSLQDMENFTPGSSEFIKEAASRALSSSEFGHVVISDITEGARFEGKLPYGGNENSGIYEGVKSFQMRPGEKFAVMLVPNGSVQQLFNNPNASGALRPLFSLVTANPNEHFHIGQIADVTGEGNTFVMEDLRVDTKSDRDYNDIIFQVRGATGKAIHLDEVIATGKDWRGSDMGQALIAYAEPYVTPDVSEDVYFGDDGIIVNLEDEPIVSPPDSGDLNEPISIPAPDIPDSDDSPSNSIGTVTDSISPENIADSDPAKVELSTPNVSEKVTDTSPILSLENQDVTVNNGAKNEPLTSVVNAPNSAETNTVAKITSVEPTKVVENAVLTENISNNATTVTESVAKVPAVDTPKEVESAIASETITTNTVVKVPVVEASNVSETAIAPETTITNTVAKVPVMEAPEVLETTIARSTTETTSVADVPAVSTPKVVENAIAPNTTHPITETEVVAKVTLVETAKVTESAIAPDTTTHTTANDSVAKVTSLEPAKVVETVIAPDPSSTTTTNVTSAVLSTSTSTVEHSTVVTTSTTQTPSAINNNSTTLTSEIASTTQIETSAQTTTPATTSPTVTTTQTALPIQQPPVKAAVPKPPVTFDFPKANQPLVGVIDTGFSANNPDIDYTQIKLGHDYIGNDTNPFVQPTEGNDPGTQALGIIAAKQNNGIGINGINDDAPLWVGRAEVNSEEWAQSLMEFVDAAKTSKQPNAIVNLSFNLTNLDGTPRFELTTVERAALAYAQQHNVLIVASAGDNPGEMSAVGQASLEFDNIVTVGSAERVNNSVAPSKAYDRAEYSGSGYALDIVAPGGTDEQPITVTSGNGVTKEFGTSVATAKVSGAASQVWAANPDLSYRQVIDILKRTATDLKTPNWDVETGAGLLNIAAAVHLAKVTPAIDVDVPVRYDFKKSDQPLIGIIDTGFVSKNPDIDYRRIILGRDRVDNDNNPLLENGEGSEHGSHILGIIGATQGNGMGIDGMNDDAPIWLGRAIGSGKWAESLREFVDAAKASGQPNAVVNLSFDLTQINPDGSVTTRYELTPQEREALEYARQNGVMVVVAAGNNGGTMSALGQASQEFDNVITVGSIDYNGNRADYSNLGFGLDFVARGGTSDRPVMSTVGEGADLGLLSGEEEPPEDEMSIIARNTFEEVFGPFSAPQELESDEQELENLTPEERQVYDEATKEIDQLLKDYLGAASQKIALEYVDGYYAASVDALSQFVDAFDEDLADNLIKAEEILGNAGFSTNASTTATNLDFSIPLDLGVGEMAGTSVAAAKVTGAVSQVWAANPGLSYPQVKEILQKTAVDLNSRGWDAATGSGLVNVEAAIELAKRTQPQSYQPKPIQSPLTWSGEGKVTPGERAVSVSVPSFTGRVMDAGYVTSVGFLRIRSGPGQGYGEVGRKYPGEAINFDAYENNGSWVDDPYMPGGGSSRWYKIAGTNNWMSALYIDNTPERAEQERQRLEAIRRAEEEARRAEEEARRAEEEARRAEEELQQILEEQRRAEEEARRRAEEEARRRIEEELRRILEEERRKQEQFQALVNEVAKKHGELGALLGSYVSNGVTVYQFARGVLLVQSDLSHAFYEIAKDKYEENQESLIKFVGKQTAQFILKNQKNLLDNLVSYKKIAEMSGQNGFVVLSPRIGDAKNAKYIKFVKGANLFGLTFDALWTLGKAHLEPDPDKKREILVKGGFQIAGSAIGAGLGSVAGGFLGGLLGTFTVPVLGTISGATVGAVGGSMVGGFLGGQIGGFIGDSVNENWDSIMAAKDAVGQAINNAGNAVSSFTNSALEAAKEKAKAAVDKAKELADKAKVAYQTATATVEQAKAAYQTFKTEVQKVTTQIVQQSQQKIKEEAQKILIRVAQNPVVQQGSKLVKQITHYAQKAVQTVGSIINGAKQFANNIINAGKKMVNNVIETGKKAYETVKNVVTNAYETGKKVVTETYNKTVQAVNTVKDTVSNGFNAVKSVFRFGW